jgi:hypothetical protein
LSIAATHSAVGSLGRLDGHTHMGSTQRTHDDSGAVAACMHLALQGMAIPQNSPAPPGQPHTAQSIGLAEAWQAVEDSAVLCTAAQSSAACQVPASSMLWVVCGRPGCSDSIWQQLPTRV